MCQRDQPDGLNFSERSGNIELACFYFFFLILFSLVLLSGWLISIPSIVDRCFGAVGAWEAELAAGVCGVPFGGLLECTNFAFLVKLRMYAWYLIESVATLILVLTGVFRRRKKSTVWYISISCVVVHVFNHFL